MKSKTTTTKAVKTPVQPSPPNVEARKAPPKIEISAKAKPQKEFSEMVIKEIMVQKQCSREKAIQILESHK